MLIIVLAALLITLPATAVIIFLAGHIGMVPALASLAVNTLPFLAIFWVVRNQRKHGEEDQDPVGH